MKRFIAIVLGLAAGLSTTFGQGWMAFDNYNSDYSVPTTFGAGVAGHPAGSGLTSSWTAGLLYSITPITDAATTDSASSAASLNPAWSVAPITAVYDYAPGHYVSAVPFFLSDGFAGQVVYFELIAFETAAIGADSAERYANSTARGHSASFTGVLNWLPNAPAYMNNLQQFSVFTVPEPSTLALAGLGLAALMAYRRKQA